jgi:hypothetical protein
MSQAKIKLIDKNSLEVIAEFELAQAEAAYQKAAELEEYGLDIIFDSPTITKTLSNSLGISNLEEKKWEDSLKQELEDHDSSCCVKLDPTKLH